MSDYVVHCARISCSLLPESLFIEGGEVTEEYREALQEPWRHYLRELLYELTSLKRLRRRVNHCLTSSFFSLGSCGIVCLIMGFFSPYHLEPLTKKRNKLTLCCFFSISIFIAFLLSCFFFFFQGWSGIKGADFLCFIPCLIFT